MFNIGTGKGLSVLQIIKAFESTNNLRLNYSIGSRRDGDIDEIFSDNKKVLNILKWNSEISIEQAMIDAWNWQINMNK